MNPIRNIRDGGPQGYNQNATGFRQKIPVPVQRNPMKEGKHMLCNICGAFTHLQAKCPHNPNNKTYVVGEWDKVHDAVEEIGEGFYP